MSKVIQDDLMDHPVLLVQELSQAYGQKLVLKKINFTIGKGEIVALRGTNGSGKTTLMRALCGLVTPRSGRVILNSVDSAISLFTPDCFLFDDLTVAENLSFYQKIYGALPERLENLFQLFLLDKLRDIPVCHLSLGQKIRTGLARCFLMPAQVYLLDEPFGALDQKSHEQLIEGIVQLKNKGCGVLIATHVTDNFAGLFNRTLILDDGTIK